MSNLTLTKYFDDYMEYFRKAKILEERVKLGGEDPTGLVGDELMEKVEIYDVTDRQHAGINDMIQDLWFNLEVPKAKFRKTWPSYYDNLESYKILRHKWDRETWLYVWLVHRITGSGASYVQDHGYRNTILPELAKCNNITEMTQFIREYDDAMYTSKGCQIPGFPKVTRADLCTSGIKYAKGGKMYLCEVAPKIINALSNKLDSVESEGRKINIRDIVDWMNSCNQRLKFNRFIFQHSLFAADVSDYYPNLVNEYSPVYYGKNAVEALDLLATTNGTRMNKLERHDTVAKIIQERTGAKPKGVENSLCDYIKYIENQIPKGPFYAHLDRKTLWSNSIISDHPKGRQQWKLNTEHWKW